MSVSGGDELDKPWRAIGSPAGVPARGVKPVVGAAGAVVSAIQEIQKQREARRQVAHVRKEKEAKAAVEAEADDAGIAPGVRVDKDTLGFIRMIKAYRAEHGLNGAWRHAEPGSSSICVVVRKRPINKREVGLGDYDAVTCLNPRAIVHAPKLKVDGITKYVENTTFQFDHTFGEEDDTETVYKHTVQPLVGFAFQRKGRGMCFAYGQTGSGKTHTMNGVQQLAARDIFRALASSAFRSLGLTVWVSFFEIYGGRAFDVLHDNKPIKIQEDGKQRVVAVGLQEVQCRDEEGLMDVIARGNSSRKTATTEVNNTSSRSHALCDINIRGPKGEVWGSLTLIDLAGSERAADSRNHNQTRRVESAEINKSLLGLKECMRALAQRTALAQGPNPADAERVHVPFRASRLTLALRDSFTAQDARVVMIATVSPNASSWDHTGNTLRYADRVKEQPAAGLEGAGGASGDEASEGGREGGGRRPETSFSFLQEDAAGTAHARPSSGPAALLPPRISPMTVSGDGSEGGGSEGGSGSGAVITDAKAPPKNIFQRFSSKPAGSGPKPSDEFDREASGHAFLGPVQRVRVSRTGEEEEGRAEGTFARGSGAAAAGGRAARQSASRGGEYEEVGHGPPLPAPAPIRPAPAAAAGGSPSRLPAPSVRPPQGPEAADGAPLTGLRRLMGPKGALFTPGPVPAPAPVPAAVEAAAPASSLPASKAMKDKFRDRSRRHAAGAPVTAPVAGPPAKAGAISPRQADREGARGPTYSRATAGSYMDDMSEEEEEVSGSPRRFVAPVQPPPLGAPSAAAARAVVAIKSPPPETRARKAQLAVGAHPAAPVSAPAPASPPRREAKPPAKGSASRGSRTLKSEGPAAESEAVLAARLHEAVAMIVDEEQELLEAHMHAIQVRRTAALHDCAF